eukprot:TRINITY_DN7778_c0_g2_i2.p3 TRINITY_DN7778_c0_g2~~TRINITY_DN7778_c0_g2_i2.p3  ORF type:complete len:123 (-),score=21.43 TRINITY_DN7778_c0_g2_i2:209-577(-)
MQKMVSSISQKKTLRNFETSLHSFQNASYFLKRLGTRLETIPNFETSQMQKMAQHFFFYNMGVKFPQNLQDAWKRCKNFGKMWRLLKRFGEGQAGDDGDDDDDGGDDFLFVMVESHIWIPNV